MITRKMNDWSKFILAGMAIGLLLPLYGSWINVRFAAPQPNHKHIYLGKVDLNHHRTADSTDVVILPDQDVIGLAVVLIGLPIDIMVPKSADNDTLSYGLSDEYKAPENTFLPPPDHPPRI